MPSARPVPAVAELGSLGIIGVSITITKRVTKEKLPKILPRPYAERCGAVSVPEPMTVIVFDDSVVTSGTLRKALRRAGHVPVSSLVLAGPDFTEESRAIAAAQGAFVLSGTYQGWTDQSHEEIRTLIASKVKTPDLR